MNLVEVDELVIGPAGRGAAVVEGVSFTVPRGGALALVGRSGSGKTTTALSLLGRLRPGLVRRSGRIRVDGRDPFDPAGARQLLGRVVSYLGQDPAATLTPSRRIGSLIAEAGAGPGRVEELLDAVHLPTDRAFQRRRPHELSGGQAQRAALAVALAPRPSLLVLDEPTSGLDPVLAVAFCDLVAGILRDGATTAVLVSHDTWLVSALADEVLEMSAGRVTATRLPRPPQPLQATAAARHTSAPRLAADGLTAAYDRRGPVVRDVSFTVPAGGCLAVVGPSGSGKSTLTRVVTGLLPPVAGRIELDGARLASRARDRTAGQRRAVQLVAQDSHGALNPRETVGRALLRPLRGLRGLDGTAGAREARALLERVELPEVVLHRHPHALSGGERQRVNLARALAAGPTVLLCDEITSALDPELSIAMADLLGRLSRELGVAVLLITHELPIAARIADEIAVLDAGRIVEHGPTAPVLGDPTHELTRALVAAQERSDGRATSRNSRPA